MHVAGIMHLLSDLDTLLMQNPNRVERNSLDVLGVPDCMRSIIMVQWIVRQSFCIFSESDRESIGIWRSILSRQYLIPVYTTPMIEVIGGKKYEYGQFIAQTWRMPRAWHWGIRSISKNTSFELL